MNNYYVKTPYVTLTLTGPLHVRDYYRPRFTHCLSAPGADPGFLERGVHIYLSMCVCGGGGHFIFPKYPMKRKCGGGGVRVNP